MVTQQEILDLMEQSQDNPAIAEAAYLASVYLDTEQIDRNLRLRYGSGQGFAMFKERIIEMTEYASISSENNRSGAQIEFETTEGSTQLNRVSAEDVEIGLDKVIRDGFDERVAGKLAGEVQENLPSLSQSAKLLAYIAIRGHDLGIWDDRRQPDSSSLWKIYSIIRDETLTEPRKTDIVEELVENGCFYANGSDVLLTPAFVLLEDPYKHLASLNIETPD